jgi:hypothetical protein
VFLFPPFPNRGWRNALKILFGQTACQNMITQGCSMPKVRFLCIYVLAGGMVISQGRSRTAWPQQARLFVHFAADVTAITLKE